MEQGQLQNLVRQLIALPKETEWVEFKHNNADPGEIGEYVSALSNSAALHGKQCAYVLWGVEDTTQPDRRHHVPPPRKRKSATRNWKTGFSSTLTHGLTCVSTRARWTGRRSSFLKFNLR